MTSDLMGRKSVIRNINNNPKVSCLTCFRPHVIMIEAIFYYGSIHFLPANKLFISVFII